MGSIADLGKDYGKPTRLTVGSIVDLGQTDTAPLPKTLAEIIKKETGTKNDTGKLQWSYLPVSAIKEVLKVLAYGDSKYPAEDGANWKRVPDAKKRYYNALLRHVTSWWDGERNDPETGIHHLAHACSNCLFLLWFELKGYQVESKTLESDLQVKNNLDGRGERTKKSTRKRLLRR